MEEAKLTLFERMIFIVIVQVMHIVGVPAKYKTNLSEHLYWMAMAGKICETDIKRYE